MTQSNDDDLGIEIRVRKRRPLRPPFAPPRKVTETVRGGSPTLLDRSVVFEDCVYEDVSFAGVRFDYFGSLRSSFDRCDFTRARLRGSLGLGAVDSVFRDCRFDRSDMTGIYPGPGHVRFERCSFESVRFKTWISDDAEYVDCVFAGVVKDVLFKARGSSPNEYRSRNEFRGNDFSGAQLRGVSFEWGIDLSAQKLPVDQDHVLLDRWPERATRARAEIVRWSDLDERRDALEMLDFLTAGGRAEQEQLYADRDFWTLTSKPVRDRVWALLERC